MKAIYFIFLLTLYSGVATNAFAENWIKFFSSASGYDLVYSEISRSYPDKDIILAWYIGLPQKRSEFKEWNKWVELREVNCAQRNYKRFQGRITYENKSMEKLKETSWIYLEPNDLVDIAFYNIACKGRGNTSTPK